MTDDIDIDAEARRLSAKWRMEKPKRLDENEAAIARKIVGRDNAERLQHAKDGRPFRPAPVNIHYEYWWFDGGSYSMGGVQMARIENGRQEPHSFKGDIRAEIKALRDKGFTVREVRLGDFERPRKQQLESRKKRILADLANFKMGRR